MSRVDKSKKPLAPHTDSAGLNSEIHAATSIQSSVTPEDYPASEREGQTAIVGKIDAGEQNGRKKTRNLK